MLKREKMFVLVVQMNSVSPIYYTTSKESALRQPFCDINLMIIFFFTLQYMNKQS